MKRVWSAIRAADLLEEAAIVIALALVAAGFWSFWRPGAYLVPGGVLLWLFLPTRRSFIAPPAAPPARRDTA